VKFAFSQAVISSVWKSGDKKIVAVLEISARLPKKKEADLHQEPCLL